MEEREGTCRTGSSSMAGGCGGMGEGTMQSHGTSGEVPAVTWASRRGSPSGTMWSRQLILDLAALAVLCGEKGLMKEMPGSR